MIESEKIVKRIASLRRERGYTGEELAELLHISPQAVSKWENAKCLPETSILPALAQALHCSIDSLLSPRELFILEAVYTDGQTHIPITRFLDDMVRDNTLNNFKWDQIAVNHESFPSNPASDDTEYLTLIYVNSEGIQSGKPVLAINLRVAPEWGVITGYTDHGSRFLCRTYFDKDVFAALEQEDNGNEEDRRIIFEDNEGYLFNDSWPFLIIHFGEKTNRPSQVFILKTSLTTLVDSFQAKECRGYYQGKDAYKAWIKGLSAETDFRLESDKENVIRRLTVNDNMLCNLIDSRNAAAAYLRENIALLTSQGQAYLSKIAENYQTITDTFSAFRCKLYHSSSCAASYNTINAFGVSTPKLRKEQIGLLENALILEEENCRLAELILEMPEM